MATPILPFYFRSKHYLFDPQLPDKIYNAYNERIPAVPVPVYYYGGIVAVAYRGKHLRFERIGIPWKAVLFSVDVYGPLLRHLDGHLHRLILGPGALRLGKVDLDLALVDQRGRYDKYDEQDQHHVRKGRYVDFGHKAFFRLPLPCHKLFPYQVDCFAGAQFHVGRYIVDLFHNGVVGYDCRHGNAYSRGCRYEGFCNTGYNARNPCSAAG